MASAARISVMTTLFSCVTVDIVVPLVVLAAVVVASEAVFAAADLFTVRGRAA